METKDSRLLTRTQRQIKLVKIAIGLALSLAMAQTYFHQESLLASAQGARFDGPTSSQLGAQASRLLTSGQGARFDGPTSSQPLALSADDSLLVAANPDNDSVTIFDVHEDENRRLMELPVQDEPNGVALLPNGSRAYAANTISGTVSVIDPHAGRVLTTIAVGTEPYGLALTPNGRKLYVTNARSNSLSVIDTASNKVLQTVNVGIEPRGIAITNDGDGDDNDETVYVTQFLALPVAIGKLDGEDDSKVGLVTVLSTATDSVQATVVLRPLADTGFKAAGDAIARIPPPANPQPADFKFTTGAYPNQLQNIGIKGNFAYVPATGSSPNGPVRFDVNTQSLLAVINQRTNADAGHTINMHLAVAQQTNPSKLFITQPWAIAFKNKVDEGYVISAASNIVVKVAVDPNTGAPTVQNDPFDASRVLQLRVGKNPRGIIVNSTDTRAYVMNYVSRDVSVVDLTRVPEQVIATMRSSDLPRPGTLEDMIHIGKELYNTSIGEFDSPAPGQPPIAGRMSRNGWGACSTCHPFGLSDHVVWIFASGPRRSISQHTDFDLTDPQRKTQRALNWSAIFDEEEDFELNIRGVSGGLGLIVQADGITPDNPVAAFTPPNAGRQQLKVRGVNAWDAIKAFEKFGIRPPISPLAKTDPDVMAGEALFRQSNCQQCHGGPQWTSSKVRFTPPPPASEVSNTELINELRQVGTFDPNLKNEIRANATAPLGADGFAPASLLSVFAVPKTFLHNGGADSLDAMLLNVEHRSVGTGGVDLLEDAEARRKLVKFLLSIDARTPPIAGP
jgi:YVTN family beta-propeller protein